MLFKDFKMWFYKIENSPNGIINELRFNSSIPGYDKYAQCYNKQQMASICFMGIILANVWYVHKKIIWFV